MVEAKSVPDLAGDGGDRWVKHPDAAGRSACAPGAPQRAAALDSAAGRNGQVHDDTLKEADVQGAVPKGGGSRWGGQEHVAVKRDTLQVKGRKPKRPCSPQRPFSGLILLGVADVHCSASSSGRGCSCTGGGLPPPRAGLL